MLRFARALTDLMVRRAEERPVPPAPVAVYVPEDEAPATSQVDDVGVAEGQSFVIEYRDERGNASRRRISVWSIKRNAKGIPVLQAQCHERNAFRPFRVDRIACCIDYNGEIFDDVPAFMAETFGMAPWPAAEERRPRGRAPRAPKLPGPRWIDTRNIVKHDAALLSALSHCDGIMCEDEVGATVHHCVETAKAHGIVPPDDVHDRLSAYARRLHPTPRVVIEAMEALLASNPNDQRRFLVAAVTVIDADGHRHPEEIAMINRFAVDLLGTRIA